MQKEQRGDDFIPGSNADPSDKNQKKRTWRIIQRVIDEQINLLILSCCFLSSCVFFLTSSHFEKLFPIKSKNYRIGH